MGAVTGPADPLGSPYSAILRLPPSQPYFFLAKPLYARHRRFDRDGADSHPAARGDQPRSLFFFCSL